ncbi:MAG: MarR family winged helix-turn-helix transcriptional regulator [Bacteroidota bacterium]
MSKNIFPFEKPEENSGFLLWQVTMCWQRQMKQALDKLGLTHTQFVLLAALKWLSQNQSEVYQIEVAHHAQVDKMMTSKIVKTLVSKQFVKTQNSKQDKRAKPLILTAQGNKILQNALTVVKKVDTDFFSSLRSKEAEYQRMMQSLMKNREVNC